VPLEPKDILSVAEDTLYFRRVVQLSPGSCMAYNGAAPELLKFGVPAMPVIEKLVIEKVAPALEVTGSVEPLGLTILFGCYLQIGVKNDLSRVMDFYRSLSDQMKFSAVTSVAKEFRFFGDGRGYRDNLSPPLELVDFVRECLSSGNMRLRGQSARVLSIILPK